VEKKAAETARGCRQAGTKDSLWSRLADGAARIAMPRPSGSCPSISSQEVSLNRYRKHLSKIDERHTLGDNDMLVYIVQSMSRGRYALEKIMKLYVCVTPAFMR
jgi:hypothetical protein